MLPSVSCGGSFLALPDARHVFQAARNGVDYFVTCDVKTLVKHAAAVYEIVGIRVRLPSQVLAELATEIS
jgi:hypothetical protein